MQAILKRLSVLGTGTLLLACADIGFRPPPPSAMALAEQAYAAGRSHHLAQRHAQAMLSYSAALRAAPAHVRARNGLAALHAELGDLAQAIALWQPLTATAQGTQSAYLFSNLGYAYFLQGDYTRAEAALQVACLRDPLNYRAWHHLGNVLAKLGQQERADAMLRQAEALQGHDFISDYAMARASGLAAIDSAVRAPRKADGWAQTEVSQAADGMFVMRRIEAHNPQPVLAGHAPEKALLEIRNGNGVTGMARALARTMGGESGRVVRLSNEKGFSVKHTRVEYQLEFKGAAERLAGRVGAAQMVKVDDLGRADIRLVIGHDMIKTPPPAVASTVRTLPESG